jgi:hypothetical protein
MIRDRLERIKERAYALWEKAGGGHGDDQSHWHQASREIDDEDAKPARSKSLPKRNAVPEPVQTSKVAKSPKPASVPATQRAEPKASPGKAPKSSATSRKPATLPAKAKAKAGGRGVPKS